MLYKGNSAVQIRMDDLPLRELRLKARWYRALDRKGIQTVGQLKSLTDIELLNIKQIGSTAILAIREAIADLSVPLPAEVFKGALTPRTLLLRTIFRSLDFLMRARLAPPARLRILARVRERSRE